MGEVKRARQVILAEEGWLYPEQRREVAADVLVVWTGRIPDGITASPLTGATRRVSVRHTFAGQERSEAGGQSAREVSAPPVVFYKDAAALSFVHTGVSYRRRNDESGDDELYQFAELPRGTSAPEGIGDLPVAGFVAISLGRFRAGAGPPG